MIKEHEQTSMSICSSAAKVQPRASGGGARGASGDETRMGGRARIRKAESHPGFAVSVGGSWVDDAATGKRPLDKL